MKYIYIKIFLVLFIFGTTSCDLDRYPHSQVATEKLTDDDVLTMLNGLYYVTQNKPTVSGYVMFDIIGGNLIRGGASGLGGYDAMIKDIMQPEQGIISSQWNGYYTNLYQVNQFIISANKLDESATKQRMLGEAYFFRGLIYYNLVTRWGGVPILREPFLTKVARASEAETWAFVEENLQLAIDQCESFSNYFYVSREAATALMARVKLAQNKMSEAEKLAESLINGTAFKLDEFEKIFRGKSNSEVIFCFANLIEESGVNLSGSLFYTRSHPVGGSYQYAPSNEVMIGLFEPGDKREDISIDIYGNSNVINKYPSGEAGRDPLMVTRLGEMFLISAEAKGYPNGLNRLNELRAFRGLPPATPNNQKDFINAILKERRTELLAEGFRWYDLVRLGRVQDDLKLPEALNKLPIPSRELLLNDLLVPNPGY